MDDINSINNIKSISKISRTFKKSHISNKTKPPYAENVSRKSSKHQIIQNKSGIRTFILRLPGLGTPHHSTVSSGFRYGLKKHIRHFQSLLFSPKINFKEIIQTLYSCIIIKSIRYAPNARIKIQK